MDIYIISITNPNIIDEAVLKNYQHKNITNKNKCRLHCLAYYMLDNILKENFKAEDREIIFENGKPILSSHKKHISISHTKNCIALAFSDYNCGIDVEYINPKRDFKAISDRMGFVNVETTEDFYREWTKYEAEYKLASQSFSNYTDAYYNCVLTAVSGNSKESYDIHLMTI